VSELVNHLLDHADFLRFRVCNYTNLERGLANDIADDCQKAARQLVAHDALVKAAREVANADTDVQLRYGIFRLEAALAAVDGGGQ